MSQPVTPESQLEWWNRAVELLGGKRATAAGLPINERTMRYLCAGELPLHEGHLRDIARLLLAHAEACRQAERALSPAFVSNLTGDQRHHKPHGNSYHLRGKGE